MSRATKLHLSNQAIAYLQELCAHAFSDKRLLVQALTHPSATEDLPSYDSYERLEFLGDSILGAFVAADLFTLFPTKDEGQLSQLKVALVSGQTLSQVALKLNLDRYIIFGMSQKGTGKRGLKSALEDVYEALVGALYLDAGAEVTHAFIKRTLGPYMNARIVETSVNPKTRLQEICQRSYKTTPSYKLTESTGPAHAPTFCVVVTLDGVRYGRGKGSSKKEAEAAAARAALKELGYDEQSDHLKVDEVIHTIAQVDSNIDSSIKRDDSTFDSTEGTPDIMRDNITDSAGRLSDSTMYPTGTEGDHVS